MCEIVTKENIPFEEHPRVVYKLLLKVDDETYLTPVMGDVVKVGVWNVATCKSCSHPYTSLVKQLPEPNIEGVRRDKLSVSSQWSSDHANRWACYANMPPTYFSNFRGKLEFDLVNNFEDEAGRPLPQVVAECNVGGKVSKSHQENAPDIETYLVEKLWIARVFKVLAL